MATFFICNFFISLICLSYGSLCLWHFWCFRWILESGKTNFIQSNYKPYYRVYKAEYTEDEKQSIKLIIDIEISGKVEEIKIDKVSKNKQNIITIKGKRSLGKKKSQEDDNDDNKKKKKYFSEHKSSYFTDNSTLFNLRIFIPIEKCIVGDLYKEIDYEDEGLYRFIYNIQDENILTGTIKGIVISSDDEDQYNDDE